MNVAILTLGTRGDVQPATAHWRATSAVSPARPVVRAMLLEMMVEPTMVPMATVLTKSKILAVPTVVLPARRSNRMA